jgi:hypothetical protein
VRRLQITHDLVAGRPQRRRAPGQAALLIARSIDIGDIARATIFATRHDEPVRTPARLFPVSSTTKHLAYHLPGLALTAHFASQA